MIPQKIPTKPLPIIVLSLAMVYGLLSPNCGTGYNKLLWLAPLISVLIFLIRRALILTPAYQKIISGIAAHPQTDQAREDLRAYLIRNIPNATQLIDSVLWIYNTSNLEQLLKQYAELGGRYISKLIGLFIAIFNFLDSFKLATVFRILFTGSCSTIVFCFERILFGVAYYSDLPLIPLYKLVAYITYAECPNSFYRALGCIQVTLLAARNSLNFYTEAVLTVSAFSIVAHWLRGLFQYSSSEHDC